MLQIIPVLVVVVVRYQIVPIEISLLEQLFTSTLERMELGQQPITLAEHQAEIRGSIGIRVLKHHLTLPRLQLVQGYFLRQGLVVVGVYLQQAVLVVQLLPVLARLNLLVERVERQQIPLAAAALVVVRLV